MGTALAIIYFTGVIAAAVVGRSRAGVSRLSVGTIFGSLPWVGTQVVAMAAWPLFLCVWLARGRPPTPWKSTTTRTGSVRIQREVTFWGEPAGPVSRYP